jgi:HNH endonuclease
MADQLSDGSLRIWKHSHGKGFTDSERDAYRERSVLTIYRTTRKGQGAAFRTEMSFGDFFYLTHGNDIQLFGQISSVLKQPRAEWVEREYVTIRNLQHQSGHFRGSPKWWAPNANMTCVKVPERELKLFEKEILFPYFRLRLRDLEQLPCALVQPEELERRASGNGRKYEEALKHLVQHQALETVRNRKLVSDAKSAFKHKHGKLFCEVCDFDFSARYGERGTDYIEAHHLVPISQLSAATLLTTKDLAMVCANCHRMLHRTTPWISVKKLRTLLQSPSQTC